MRSAIHHDEVGIRRPTIASDEVASVGEKARGLTRRAGVHLIEGRQACRTDKPWQARSAIPGERCVIAPLERDRGVSQRGAEIVRRSDVE